MRYLIIACLLLALALRGTLGAQFSVRDADGARVVVLWACGLLLLVAAVPEAYRRHRSEISLGWLLLTDALALSVIVFGVWYLNRT